MRAWKKCPVFASALVALALVLMGEAASLVRLWPEAQSARRQLDTANREYHVLATIQPSATMQNAGLIEADLKRTLVQLTTMAPGLAAVPGASDQVVRAVVPLHRPEAYFDIATFVEAMRAAARQADVTLLPDERFGFSAYVNEAPATGLITAVFRQREVAQRLVESLLEAKPRQLLSVQRERPVELPVGAAAPGLNLGASMTKNGSGGSADYFEMDPRLSLRAPGVVSTMAFRVCFTGRTAVLRDWLNRLAREEVPIVVRSVEVGPAEASAGTTASSLRPAGALLVTPAWLRFVVTVEYVELTRTETKAS